jgi:hypothetical protein
MRPRHTKTVALALVLGAGVIGAAACAGPSTTQAEEASTAVAARAGDDEIVVEDLIAIPELREEVITEEPSSEQVWIPGYWERDPDSWRWVHGRWEATPEEGATFVPGHWAWESGSWHWRVGHWAVLGDGGYIVSEQIPIPALLPEEKPAQPSDKNHWVPGYWEWDGHWLWISGYWTSLPDPNAEWVAGHWAENSNGGWRWISGHWKVTS